LEKETLVSGIVLAVEDERRRCPQVLLLEAQHFHPKLQEDVPALIKN
jgi:hypothetical protein